MAVNRVVEQEITEEEHAAFNAKTASGNFGFGFKPGQTAFMPIYVDGLSPLSAFAQTISNFQGKENTRYVCYGIVYGFQSGVTGNDSDDDLSDDVKDTIIPIYMAKTVAGKIGRATAPSPSFTGDDKPGAIFSKQDKDGTLYYGDLFVVTRTGAGKDTLYELEIERGLLDDFFADMPESLPVPDKTIQTVADENTAQQAAKGTTPDVPKQPEVSGFR